MEALCPVHDNCSEERALTSQCSGPVSPAADRQSAIAPVNGQRKKTHRHVSLVAETIKA